jgi:hypothetical protein
MDLGITLVKLLLMQIHTPIYVLATAFLDQSMTLETGVGQPMCVTS